MPNPFVGEWVATHAMAPKKNFTASFLFAEDAEGHLRVIPTMKGYSIDATTAKMLSPREIEIVATVRAAMGLVLKTVAIFRLTSTESFEGTIKLPAKPEIAVVGRRKEPEDNSFLENYTPRVTTGAVTIQKESNNESSPGEPNGGLPFAVKPPAKGQENSGAKAKTENLDGLIADKPVVNDEYEEPVWDLGDAPQKVSPTKSFKKDGPAFESTQKPVPPNGEEQKPKQEPQPVGSTPPPKPALQVPKLSQIPRPGSATNPGGAPSHE